MFIKVITRLLMVLQIDLFYLYPHERHTLFL